MINKIFKRKKRLKNNSIYKYHNMDQLKMFQILHLHYCELNTIDEIYKYFDGKVSKHSINDVSIWTPINK